MHRNGYAESSIPTIGKRLRHLAKFCDLENPRDVKRFIAAKRVKNSFKDNLCDAYGYYVRVHGLSWTRPRYQPEQRLPKTPTTEAVEKIIARASWRYATIFSILRDTGMMPVELERTSLRDIDLERGVINAVGCKGHKPRALKLKPSTIAMLKRYLGENPKEYPFPKSESMSEAWKRYRNDIAEKLNEPTLKTIRLYDLRHYFGTMTYHRTRDILLVKELLGHSKIETTLIYTRLVNFAQDEYTVRAAATLVDAKSLLEAGFEYVCTWQGKQLYRKRK